MTGWDEIVKLDDPAAMFDLVVFGAYVAGGHGAPVPVDESRRVFQAFVPQRDSYIDEPDEVLTQDAIDWRDTLRAVREALGRPAPDGERG